MKTYWGFDPGQNGGFGGVSCGRSFQKVFKFAPTEAGIFTQIKAIAPQITCACIELVHSMPRQGVASSFKFGKNYGFLRGCLIALNIPFTGVRPQDWQKELGCLSHGDKRITRTFAMELFPKLKITHATADAILIAEYCRRKFA